MLLDSWGSLVWMASTRRRIQSGADALASTVGDGSIQVSVGAIGATGIPGDVITFGRGTSCTLRLGDGDLHVHRLVGSFGWSNGSWTLNNEGSTVSLVVSVEGGLKATIDVGSYPLVLPNGARAVVRIMTPKPYEVEVRTGGGDATAVSMIEVGDHLDAPTVDIRQGLGLTDAEFAMLVALCEPRLIDPGLQAFTVPSTKEICTRLGISSKRAEDVIDNLVNKLLPFVDGVSGSNQGRAVNRRYRIAAFAIETRCVTDRDLRILDLASGDVQGPTNGRIPD